MRLPFSFSRKPKIGGEIKEPVKKAVKSKREFMSFDSAVKEAESFVADIQKSAVNQPVKSGKLQVIERKGLSQQFLEKLAAEFQYSKNANPDKVLTDFIKELLAKKK